LTNSTFIFDGINSTDMGLHIVRIEQGLFSTPYISGQNIIEDDSMKRNMPNFYRTKKNPLEIRIIFSTLCDKFTPEKRYQIAQWLIHDEYKIFQSTDDLAKFYNVIAISNSEFISNGNNQGYFEVIFRCDAPWAWSSTAVYDYDLSDITTPTTITVDSLCNVFKYYYPEVEFKLQDSNTAIKLKNLSDGGNSFEFTGLTALETIYVNNENRRVITDQASPNNYRLGKFNLKWLRLVYGLNYIEVTGKCLLQFRMKFPIYR